MSQLLRVGCAGVALIAIAALTSIGLYAVVAGQFFTVGTAARGPMAGAPVMVTIQAGPGTPTSVAAATETRQPASLLPGSTAAAAPAPVATPTPASGQAVVPSAPASAAATVATVAAATTPAPAAAPVVAAANATAAVTPAAEPVASRTAASTAATPAPASPEPAASAGPVESPRSAVHEGMSLEVLAAERGWQATAPDGTVLPPRDGFQQVAVLVRLTNRASELRHLADSDIVLVGEDGSRYSPRATGQYREPRLPTLPILPGDVVRGWLTYETQTGDATTRLQWSPTRPDRPRADAAYSVELPR